MARRSIEWNDGLAENLKDAEFARAFLLEAIEEDISIQEALGKAIRAQGVKEFSKKVRLPSSNILRAINPKSNPTLETINKLLKPFKLQLSLRPIKKTVA